MRSPDGNSDASACFRYSVPLVDGTTPAALRVGFQRHPQRAGECLEDRLALVMRVVTAQIVDVKRDQCVIDEALKELVRQVNVELAHHCACEWHMPLEARTSGKIDHDPRQRFVQRDVRKTEAANAFLVADGTRDRLPKGDADILDRVVAIDVQIALGFDREIERAMAGDLIEHVIEKTDASGQMAGATAVEVHDHADLRLGGVAYDFCDALAHGSFATGSPSARRQTRHSRPACRSSPAGSPPAADAHGRHS